MKNIDVTLDPLVMELFNELSINAANDRKKGKIPFSKELNVKYMVKRSPAVVDGTIWCWTVVKNGGEKS